MQKPFSIYLVVREDFLDQFEILADLAGDLPECVDEPQGAIRRPRIERLLASSSRAAFPQFDLWGDLGSGPRRPSDRSPDCGHGVW